MRHPNLYFDRKDIENYRARLLTDTEAKARCDALISRTDECLDEEFITQAECDSEGSFGTLISQANRFADVLGTKYILDGDVRCFEKLKRFFESCVSFERFYTSEFFDRKPFPWHSDLRSAALVTALGRIYDVIREELTEEERKTFASGLYDKGVLPAMKDWVLHDTRIHAVDSMGHNWWAVCICETAVGFVAISDDLDPDTVKTLNDGINDAVADFLSFGGNPLFNKIPNFDSEGLFYESLGYGDYAMSSLFRWLFCYERFFGRNERIRSLIPENICNAFMSFLYPVTKDDGSDGYLSVDFGDSDIDRTVDGFAIGAVLLGIDNPAVRKCASFSVPCVWDEIGGLCTDKLEGSWDCLPLNTYFPSGFAILRESWKPDAALFAVKSGYAWNHSHNDAGHFILWNRGKPIFPDSQTCNYINEIYRDYYCQDMSHNVLRIGGKGCIHDCVHFATKFPGTIPEHFDGDGFTYIRADCGGPMAHLCTRMFRNFIWIENRILVIFDDVFCIEENDVQFLLHYIGSYSRESENSLVFDNGTSSAKLISHYPEGMTATDVMGYINGTFDEGMPYLSISTPDKTLRHLLVSTIELDSELHDTRIEALHSEKARGIRISDSGREYEIWYNVMAEGKYMHDNSINIIADYETDAYMLIITRNENDTGEKVSIINGSFLRRDGRVFFGSHTKRTVGIGIPEK